VFIRGKVFEIPAMFGNSGNLCIPLPHLAFHAIPTHSHPMSPHSHPRLVDCVTPRHPTATPARPTPKPAPRVSPCFGHCPARGLRVYLVPALALFSLRLRASAVKRFLFSGDFGNHGNFFTTHLLTADGSQPQNGKTRPQSRVSGFSCSGRSPNEIRNHPSMISLRCNKKVAVRHGMVPTLRRNFPAP